ncbi:hypothetical protein G7054_g5864 [Neopestalotiopsis clavispora]|nr:hypothetical protein G7054_g5864 [Neopestalotiopsis clavispora]
MSMFHSRTLWAVVVAAAPLAYVLCIKAAYDTSTTVSFAMDDGEGDDAQNDDGSANYTDTVPAQSREEEEGDNDDNDGQDNTTSSWVVVRERVVSNPFTVTTDVEESKEQIRLTTTTTTTTDLVNTYLGTTMRLFTYTPQAWLMRRMITDPEARRTFTAGYLSACDFQVGDRVCGVYVVAERRRSSSQATEKRGQPCCSETVVLALAPPEGWKGPVVQGRLEAGLEEQGEANDDDDDDDDESSVSKSKGLSTSSRTFRAVNETVLWRRREGEAPVFLEGVVGRWLHAFMVQWMVVKGVQAVLRER